MVFCDIGVAFPRAQIVAPKKVRLAEAEAELAKTMEVLNEKRAELKAAEDKLDSLKNQFQEMIDKKARLEWQVRVVFPFVQLQRERARVQCQSTIRIRVTNQVPEE